MEKFAHKLTSSQPNFFAELKLAGMMVALLATVGCDVGAFQSPLASLQAGSSSGNSPLAVSREIDAGVIFAGQANYLCLPLAELGLDGVNSASDIAAMSSSCECVQPSLIGYQHSHSRTEDALRLDFAPDQPTDGQYRPAHLAVEVTLKLNSGTTQTLKINVLATQPVVVAPILDRSDHDQES